MRTQEQVIVYKNCSSLTGLYIAYPPKAYLLYNTDKGTGRMHLIGDAYANGTVTKTPSF